MGIFLAKYLSLKLRLITGLLFVFGLTLTMPFIVRYLSEDTAWVIILIIIVVYGIASSFVQGGIFGFAGIFPFKYTGAVMLGNGFSGLAMNGFRMICLAIFPPSNDTSSSDDNAFIGWLIYFAIASLLVICCIFWIFLGLKNGVCIVLHS